MRKCEDCGYLESEGYEYPEYYCAAGVSEDDEHYNGEGCNYTYRQLKKRFEDIREAEAKAYYIPICKDCLYYPMCKDKDTLQTSDYDYVCGKFKDAADFAEMKSCDGCYWKSIKRYHKCYNCSRNRKRKDNYMTIKQEE